jgi:hypothetical protein
MRLLVCIVSFTSGVAQRPLGGPQDMSIRPLPMRTFYQISTLESTAGHGHAVQGGKLCCNLMHGVAPFVLGFRDAAR